MYIAKTYGGMISPSSGAAASDQGDVRTECILIECKQTGEEGKERRSISLKLDDFEKIADEAWSEGREPMMTLRIYCPDSPVANMQGHVDLAVRLVTDDAEYVNTFFCRDDS